MGLKINADERYEEAKFQISLTSFRVVIQFETFICDRL